MNSLVLFSLLLASSVAARPQMASSKLTPEDKSTLHPYEFRSSWGVAEGLLIHRIEPDYPAEVKASGASGQVLIRLVINKEGRPIGVMPIKAPGIESTDDPRIGAAAADAVREWRFQPYLLNGRSVEVETAVILPFNFASQSPSPSPPQPPKTPKKMRISQGVADALIVHRVQPNYPSKAKEKRLTRDVILQVEIDRSGNVDSVKVLKGDPILAEAASDAVKQWKFKPFLLNGEPVELETTVKVAFR